jgi:hypothetical protein
MPTRIRRQPIPLGAHWISAICLSFVITSANAADSPTYHRDVLPILQNQCLNCHREGELAPMPLDSYEAVRPWAKALRRSVTEKTMPPWFADPRYGEFKNKMVLTDAEIDTIVRWVGAGSPAGDSADAPAPVEYPKGWHIGEPDEVFTMLEPYTLAAEGPDEYKYFTIPTNLTEDRWVTGFEVKPGNNAIVHHVIVFVQPKGAKDRGEGGATKSRSFVPESPEELEKVLAQQEKIQDRLRESGLRERPTSAMMGGLNMLGGVAPGTPPWTAAPGEGKLLPAGSSLVFQMHYSRNGRDEVDQTSIGVKYATGPVHRERHTVGVANLAFAIPPGANNFRVDAWHTFNEEIDILGYMPHMHLRGKSFEYRAIFPDGREEILLSVPRYDFNWQLTYDLVRPLSVPKGTTIHCIAHYDNSAENPSNPNPKAVLRFGEPTTDEMMIGWMDIVRVGKSGTQIGSVGTEPAGDAGGE